MYEKKPKPNLIWKDRRREAGSHFRASVPCLFFFKLNRYSRGLEGWGGFF